MSENNMLCHLLGHKVTYRSISSCYEDNNCERCGTLVIGMTRPAPPLSKLPSPRLVDLPVIYTDMPKCKPPRVDVSYKLDQIQSVVDLAERWCDDQENDMTDGSICISAMKDIRRILKENK